MAKKQGFVKVKLDKLRKLKYGFNAFVEMEEALGKPVTDLGKDSVSFKDIRVMLWAGLLHDDPDISLEEVGDLVDDADSLSDVAEKITEGIALALGTEEEDTEVKKEKGESMGN